MIYDIHSCLFCTNVSSDSRSIKRLSNAINKDRLKKIADSLFNSKIRYGEQQYRVVQMPLELVGSDFGLGRWASWAVHGIGAWVVHGILAGPAGPCMVHGAWHQFTV